MRLLTQGTRAAGSPSLLLLFFAILARCILALPTSGAASASEGATHEAHRLAVHNTDTATSLLADGQAGVARSHPTPPPLAPPLFSSVDTNAASLKNPQTQPDAHPSVFGGSYVASGRYGDTQTQIQTQIQTATDVEGELESLLRSPPPSQQHQQNGGLGFGDDEWFGRAHAILLRHYHHHHTRSTPASTAALSSECFSTHNNPRDPSHDGERRDSSLREGQQIARSVVVGERQANAPPDVHTHNRQGTPLPTISTARKCDNVRKEWRDMSVVEQATYLLAVNAVLR